MRKVLSFILVLILVLSVSACSAGQDSSSGGQSSAGSASLDTSEYSSWTKTIGKALRRSSRKLL